MATAPSQSAPKPHSKPPRSRNNHNSHNNNHHHHHHNNNNNNNNNSSSSGNHHNTNTNTHQYAASDSNLPAQAQTPRPRKQRPRQTDHRAASGSDIPKVTRSNQVSVSNRSPTLATPAKPAYAGPTFHASPAASALPMPKFMSKSVPPATTENSLQAKLELESESTNPNAPSPAIEPAAPAAPLAREKSPLDIFFNADRQERAKISSPSLQRRLTPPDSKGLFSMEMDQANSPRPARSPAPAPPSGSSHSDQNATPTRQEEADKHAYTQSLKSLLNLPQQPPPNSSPAQAVPQPAHESFTTPQQQRTLDQDPSLHYGNRNLSPLFQAARNQSPYSTPQRDSPSQLRQPFDPRAYIDAQAAQQSPFVTRQPYSPVQSRQQHPADAYDHQGGVSINGGHPVSPQPRHQQPPDCSPNVKDMEAKLRGMLKLC